MNKKKAAKRVNKITLELFKENLNGEKYGSATGARRAAARLSETDREVALKLTAKYFGIGLDEPGPTGRKGAKRNVKKKVAKAEVAEATPKRKPGRPRKNPLPEVAAAPANTPEAPKKRRGRPPKVKTEAAVVRTPEPEAPRRSRKSHETDQLDQIGLIGRAMGPLDAALKILEKANALANGQLNIDGFQDIADTATAAVRALKPHVSAMVHQAAPPPPISGNGQVERPFDPALLEAAAQSAGVPLPADDSVQ